jgi:hypothetical protein
MPERRNAGDEDVVAFSPQAEEGEAGDGKAEAGEESQARPLQVKRRLR